MVVIVKGEGLDPRIDCFFGDVFFKALRETKGVVINDLVL